jgi:hypothetical protein
VTGHDFPPLVDRIATLAQVVRNEVKSPSKPKGVPTTSVQFLFYADNSKQVQQKLAANRSRHSRF